MQTCRKKKDLGGLFKESHACMIVVASDCKETFDSVDKWATKIKEHEEYKGQPICLVLINKNEGNESMMIVTEAMVKEKSSQSGFTGAITISNKAMIRHE